MLETKPPHVDYAIRPNVLCSNGYYHLSWGLFILLCVEKPKIVFLLLSFIGYISQKVMDYVEIYAGN